MPFPPQHILICRTDNIGDLVLTLPLAGWLKQRFPSARIDLLCRAYALPVARRCRFVDQAFALEQVQVPDEQGIECQQDAVLAFLRNQAYDTIIFAFPDRWLAQTAKLAGIQNRVGTSHRWFHWFNCNRLAHFSRARSPLHEAQLNFRLLKPLGLDVSPALDEIPALYGLEDGGEDGAERASGTAEVQGGAQGRASIVHETLARCPLNLVLHPKSNGNGREWPIGHFAALARLLAARPDIGLLVTGSAAEGKWLARHGADLLAAPNVRNLCGSLDLGELIDLIAGSDGLVASGTGPLHLSAALGRPSLGLFPPKKPIDPSRWGPIGRRAQSLCQATPCAGCKGSEGGKGSASCACMESITPEQVERVVLAWLPAPTGGAAAAPMPA